MKRNLLIQVFILALLATLTGCGANSGDEAPRGNDGSTNGSSISPEAPLNFTATASSSTQVVLNWSDNSSYEHGYLLERAPDQAGISGVFVEIATLPENTENYIDIGLSENTTYHYRIRAYNQAGESSFSPERIATTDQVFVSTRECTTLSEPTNTTLLVTDVSELVAAVQQANNNGDVTIMLADGIYNLSSMLYITADNVTVRSDSGNRDSVTIGGQGMSGGVPHVFLVRGSNFTIADITLGWVANHGIQIQGEQDADSPHILNVRFVDTGEQMLKVTYGSNSTSSDNGIVECSTFEYSAGIGPQYYIGGIDAHQAHGWIVRNNFFNDIRSPEAGSNGRLAEHAVHFWSDSSGTLVEGNQITDCDRGIGFGLGDRGHQGGIIRNNMVHTTRDVGIGLENSAATHVYNNTLYTENYSYSIEYRFAGTQNVLISNNLSNGQIVSRNGGTGTVNTNNTSAQSSWFADVVTGDLHLLVAEVSVIDQGQTLAQIVNDFDGDLRPQGAGYDIGADEVE